MTVDENDEPVGVFSKDAVMAKGLWHRIVRIMLEDENGRILLQKRASSMKTFPNCWDNSAAGHVDAGEDYNHAARRELSEELGINEVELNEMAYYKTSDHYGDLILNRFNKLYGAKVSSSTIFHLQKDEVGEVKWFTRREIRDVISNTPRDVTAGLVQVIGDYYSKMD